MEAISNNDISNLGAHRGLRVSKEPSQMLNNRHRLLHISFPWKMLTTESGNFKLSSRAILASTGRAFGGDSGEACLWTQVMHRHTLVGYCWKDCYPHGSVCEQPSALLVRLEGRTPSLWGLDGPREGCGLSFTHSVFEPLFTSLNIIFLFLQNADGNNHSC